MTSSGIKDFAGSIARVAGSARTIDEIEQWIRSQPYTQSVHLEDYYLKSNPPQREFVVQLKMNDSVVTKVVNIFELADQRFRFNEIRDK